MELNVFFVLKLTAKNVMIGIHVFNVKRDINLLQKKIVGNLVVLINVSTNLINVKFAMKIAKLDAPNFRIDHVMNVILN